MKKIIPVMLVLVFATSCNIAAGSYPYAEIYEVENTEADLIKKVEQFKKDNPDYIVPSEVGIEDGRSDREDDYWYHVYFYYKKDNQIVYAWLRPSGEGTTSFALVGINQGLELGNWKYVNKDLSGDENDLQKEKFEKLILDKIKAIQVK